MNEVKPFITPELDAQKNAEQSNSILDGKLALLKGVSLQLQVRVGQCEVTLAQLSQMKNGELIELNKKPHDFLEVLLGEQVIARGHLVVVGEYLGIKLEEISSILS